MRFVLRSVGIAALGAAAITVGISQMPQRAKPCNPANATVARHCAFEHLVWDLARDSADHSELEAYIRMYPDGRFADEAKRQLGMLAPRQHVAVPKPSGS